jgi:hypothetical protein
MMPYVCQRGRDCCFTIAIRRVYTAESPTAKLPRPSEISAYVRLCTGTRRFRVHGFWLPFRLPPCKPMRQTPGPPLSMPCVKRAPLLLTASPSARCHRLLLPARTDWSRAQLRRTCIQQALPSGRHTGRQVWHTLYSKALFLPTLRYACLRGANLRE